MELLMSMFLGLFAYTGSKYAPQDLGSNVAPSNGP